MGAERGENSRPFGTRGALDGMAETDYDSQEAGGVAMPHVGIGVAAVLARIVARADAPARSVVDAMAPGVGAADFQPEGQPPVGHELERMVTRVGVAGKVLVYCGLNSN